MYSDKVIQQQHQTKVDEKKSIKVDDSSRSDKSSKLKDRKRDKSRSKSRDRKNRDRRSRSRSRDKRRRSRDRRDRRSRSKDRKRHRSKKSSRRDKSKERSKDQRKAEDKDGGEAERKVKDVDGSDPKKSDVEVVADNYDSDEFVEMIPKVNKKNELINEEDDKENGEDMDSLDLYMSQLAQPISKEGNGNTGEFVDEKDEDGDDVQMSLEPETLESLAESLFEDKRQKLPEINHDKTYYRKYNYNLYNEVPEVSSITQGELKRLKKSMEIHTKGKDCPKLITKWSHAIVSSKILHALKYNKMIQPTPIQCQTIPAIMSGKDVIGIAKTGSGKTLAYLLPMIRHISNQPQVNSGEGPISVVLCPTRELSIQIFQEIEKITIFLKHIRCGCIFGGADAAQQIAKLKKGVEIVVGTPGRIIDIMATNNGKNLSLSRCTFVVLDEADRMFDMGFEPQVLAIIGRIRPDKQVVMFSATFPRKIEGLAKKIMKETIEVRVGGGNKVCSDVTQHVFLMDESNKFMKLFDVIREFEDRGKILVFVEKQDMATTVSDNLNHQNIQNVPLHGGLTQEKREEAIFNFRHNNIWILIATSVAARGLDVNDLVCVINYDCPNHYEDYVHRCGRTGRAGNKGDAFTFVTPDQEVNFSWLIKALKDNEQIPPPELLEAHQVYTERMKKEGKEIKIPSGFRGHGYKFDAAEAMREKEKKLKELKEYCPDEITEEDEAILEEMRQEQKLQQQSSYSVPSDPQAAFIAHTHAKAAHQIALKLSMKLDSSGAKPDNAAATSGVSEIAREEIEINHYPANIRYILTTKDLRTTLLENFEVSMLVKGVFMQQKDIKRLTQTGERPLHLVLEAESMLNISAARSEILRVVKEAINRK